jgi:CBS domain-containing protein
MAEQNIFFLPVREFCRREYFTCTVDENVMELARTMRDHNVSSLVVLDSDEPVGIITDRDLRRKVVAEGADPAGLLARDIMSGPLIVVREEDNFFEVVYQMSHHGVHRLGVVDHDNRLCGMVNESDLIRIQTQSPQHLAKEIEKAADREVLKGYHAEIEEMIVSLADAGVKTRDLVRLISDLNDRIQRRLIELLRQEQRFTELTDDFAFVVMGSEGRSEQTLKTDQDNAIIYADHLDQEQIARLEEFSLALIDGLIEIGVPSCPGGIMAKNAFWRRPLTPWREALESWISTPSPENIMNFSMFSDLRTLHGDHSLEEQLKAHILRRTREDDVFIARMAANAARFHSPLTIFGNFKREKDGPHKGKIDLKKAGIFTLTEGIKILALEKGRLGGSTPEKIAWLRQQGVFTAQKAGDIDAAFNLLVFLRLRCQTLAIREGREPSNYIDPDKLDRVEKNRLHTALEVVKSFQGFLRGHFQLDLITN